MASRKITEIKLDYDNLTRKGLLALIESRRFLFRFGWPIFGRLRVRGIRVMRTAHGFHVTLFVEDKIAPRELNFLQLALGSNYRRECMNLRRITACRQMKSWNILYAFKFNSRGDVTSREKPEPRLSKKIGDLIKGFQKEVT